MARNMSPPSPQKYPPYMGWLVAVILVLLPFHAVFTTWLGSTFGHIDAFRIWKELLCVPLAVGVGVIAWRNRELRNHWLNQRLLWIPSLYVALTLLLGLAALLTGRVSNSALLFALVINLRFIVFMGLCMVAASRWQWLRVNWRYLLFIPALLVVSFGLLQWLVLPADVLRHVGYGATTIPAQQTVDSQAGYQRIQSTLRGPNPLGTYMVLIVTGLVVVLLRKRDQRQMGAFLVTMAGVVLFLSYSRSAYIGVAVSVGLAWWLLVSPRLRKWTVIAGAVGLLLMAGGVLVLRDNDTVQNVVFHSSEASPSVQSSNAGRAAAMRQGLDDVIHEPWGRGPGTAGPASFRNAYPPRIAENYYLQLGQEVGIVGLVLFVILNGLVAQALWLRRTDTLAVILLVSLAGITVVNLLSHAWADDTISMLWWGMAGIALAGAADGSDIIQTTNIAHDKKKKTTQKIRTPRSTPHS